MTRLRSAGHGGDAKGIVSRASGSEWSAQRPVCGEGTAAGRLVTVAWARRSGGGGKGARAWSIPCDDGSGVWVDGLRTVVRGAIARTPKRRAPLDASRRHVGDQHASPAAPREAACGWSSTPTRHAPTSSRFNDPGAQAEMGRRTHGRPARRAQAATHADLGSLSRGGQRRTGRALVGLPGSSHLLPHTRGPAWEEQVFFAERMEGKGDGWMRLSLSGGGSTSALLRSSTLHPLGVRAAPAPESSVARRPSPYRGA